MELKRLKIRIPESYYDIPFTWSRAQLYQQIRRHAFVELGYFWPQLDNNVRRLSSKYLFFNSDGTISCCRNNKAHFDRCTHEEMNWQDFLKLSKDDVIISQIPIVSFDDSYSFEPMQSLFDHMAFLEKAIMKSFGLDVSSSQSESRIYRMQFYETEYEETRKQIASLQ